VFANKIPMGILGPNRDWRKLHNEELYNLFSSPIIITMIISRKMV
jgi:hypothetical protein